LTGFLEGYFEEFSASTLHYSLLEKNRRSDLKMDSFSVSIHDNFNKWNSCELAVRGDQLLRRLKKPIKVFSKSASLYFLK
jgi:hypothetical protein